MWRPGRLSGDPDYDLHDELWTADGRCVAVVESFVTNPVAIYANALTPAGEHLRYGCGLDLAVVRDWCERVTGLKPDRPIVQRYLAARL